jgi:hypothetical protein
MDSAAESVLSRDDVKDKNPRKITKDEAMQVLARSHEAGLVHMAYDVMGEDKVNARALYAAAARAAALTCLQSCVLDFSSKRSSQTQRPSRICPNAQIAASAWNDVSLVQER